jgi:hypothetical protein
LGGPERGDPKRESYLPRGSKGELYFQLPREVPFFDGVRLRAIYEDGTTQRIM